VECHGADQTRLFTAMKVGGGEKRLTAAFHPMERW
jgi:hypothetical protein